MRKINDTTILYVLFFIFCGLIFNISCKKKNADAPLDIYGQINTVGALGLLGFAKDKDGNFILSIKQNNQYNYPELHISKCDKDGKFLADMILFGADNKDLGRTVRGTPGQASTGRLAYNPDKDEFSVATTFQEGGHQFSYYAILANKNEQGQFGKTKQLYRAQTYSHCFEQRTMYHSPTQTFYQLALGDAYPRVLGFFAMRSDRNPNFSRYFVATPKAAKGYGSNTTNGRLGDVDVLKNNNAIVATVISPFYSNTDIEKYTGVNKPCYAKPNNGDAVSVGLWNKIVNTKKYQRNLIIEVFPQGSKSQVAGNGAGMSPTERNVSQYAPMSGKDGAIAKTVAMDDGNVFLAWLEYENNNLKCTKFAIYDTASKTIIKSESIPVAQGSQIYHTVSILKDPSQPGIIKWITPRADHNRDLQFHSLDVNTFHSSNLTTAHKVKTIELPAGSAPGIDYLINQDGRYGYRMNG